MQYVHNKTMVTLNVCKDDACVSSAVTQAAVVIVRSHYLIISQCQSVSVSVCPCLFMSVHFNLPLTPGGGRSVRRAAYPTPHPDVNALIDRLLSDVRTAVGPHFIGMYLHGSLAAGDFDLARSDIDFVMVTREELPSDIVNALAAMHERVAASDLKWSTNFEGSYISARAIRRYAAPGSTHPAIRVDGSFGLDEHRSEWVIQRHVIREQGIIVVGPSPDTLIDPVSPADLKQAVSQLLEEWWRPQLANPFRLSSSEYQAYAILTMCRARFTLACGAIASKPQAAAWARENLDSRWAGLIDRAVSWRHGVELDCYAGALAFIRETLP
jgi:hypothetical protein